MLTVESFLTGKSAFSRLQEMREFVLTSESQGLEYGVVELMQAYPLLSAQLLVSLFVILNLGRAKK